MTNLHDTSVSVINGATWPRPRAGPAPPAGPPKAAALAHKLGCRVTGPESGGEATYDTVQYVDVSGSPCVTGSFGGQGIIIMTFASAAKEVDWLHQNAAAEGSMSGGYFEVVSGHLWAIASSGYGAFQTAHLIRKLGGRDTTF